MLIGFCPLNDKLEFVGRADSQVVRKMCVIVSALRRSVSFYSSLTNLEFGGLIPSPGGKVPRRGG